jgi:1,4-alpha-glucan branching enzyme
MKRSVKKAEAAKGAKRIPEKKKEKGGITKRYLKETSYCRVAFRLPKDVVPGAKTITIVGEFNDWDRESMPMKRLKNGDFTATVDLEAGREYRFRYLVDGNVWMNDQSADKLVPNPFGSEDSVVVV